MLLQERSRLRSKYGESKFDDQKQIQVLLTVFRQSEEQLSRARAEHYAASQRAASNYSANGLERFTLSDSQSGICVGEGDPSNVKTEKSSETGSPQLGQAVWEKTCTLSNDCNTAIGNTGNGNGENGCRLRQDDIQDCAVSSSTECGLTGSGNAASSPDTVVTSLITNMQECRVFEKSAVQVNDAANDLVSNADAQVLDDALKVAAN